MDWLQPADSILRQRRFGLTTIFAALLKRKTARRVFYLLLLSAGIYNVLLNALRFARIDSDVTDTLMLWYGFQEHGYNFIKTWVYSQDNWLLSLFPWHALLFSIFPFTPKLIILTGVWIYLLNVLLCGLIANSIQAKKSALLVPLLLLSAGEFAYTHGYITYSLTHNITNFFGLLSMFFAIRWIQHRHWASLVILFLGTVIGGLSDPWYLPCYGLPILFAVIAKKNPTDVYLLATSILAMAVIKTKAFGFCYFLRSSHFPLANWHQVKISALYFWKNSGWFINFFPAYFRWSAVASLIILFTLIGFIAIKLKQRFPQALSQRFFFLTIAWSLIILVVSFILDAEFAYENSSLDNCRYFLNVFILGILGLTVGIELYWDSFSKWTKLILITAGLLYVISGLSTVAPLWKQPPALTPNQNAGLLAVLTEHGWSYGYADYQNANIITGLSNNTIRVRPIYFSLEEGHIFCEHQVQTSPIWCTPQDIPPGQKTFFIYLHPMFNNKDVQFFRQKLIEQYGLPIQALPYQGSLIMVWSHPLRVEFKKKKSWEDELPSLTLRMLM